MANFPEVTEVRWEVFEYCPALTTVNMQKVEKLSYDNLGSADRRMAIFGGCTALRILLLPAIPPAICTTNSPVGYFPNTGSGSAQLVIHVGAGNVAAYTSAWGVPANVASGNSYSDVYGGNHKAILITE
jgi:hypothetical protein